MSQVYVIGRITANLELKHSQNRNPYVRMDIAENIGIGKHARVQYYQVWALGNNATRLISAKAHKGSLIWLTGSLELELYLRQDGKTTDKRMKVILHDWGFIHNGTDGNSIAANPANAAPICEELDGDKDPLPE